MYSIVLMMALSGGGDTAQAGLFHNRCSGCDCAGSACSGCYGCSGYACNGCCGGGHHHRLFGHHRGHGCHGCNGCHGGYGCCGGYACHGGYGCCGGAVCAGGYGCAGGCMGGYVVPPGPAAMPAPAPGPKPEKAPAPKPKGETQLSAPATIVVRLPADAKLTVDGVATQSTSATRVFATPVLDRGNEYFYTLTAEIARDGQTVTTTKKVTVRAGEETRVSLEFPVATVAQR